MAMDLNDPAIVHEFVEESNEHLSDIESQLLEIEQAGADIDVELVNTVFRAVHSIKGTAGFLGLDTIQHLAHVLENVLNLVRNRELTPNAENVEVMLKAADDLRGLINNIERSNDVDVSARVALLEVIAASVTDQTVVPPAGAETEGTDDPPSDVIVVDCDPDSAPDEHGPSDEVAADQETSPVMNNGGATVASGQEPSPVARDAKSVAPLTPEKSAVGGGAKPDTSIRVPVGTLDLLMNLAGELVLRRNCLMQLTARRDDNELDSVAAGLNQVTSSLQEAIMQTRMQPIGNVFSRFPRVVRDLNAKLGKLCEVAVEGSTVEVDKSILESIVDPLTHLVRNAIDHGVELPEERVRAGKTIPAQLRLSAYHQAGRVCIDVADNGRGIDPQRIKAKAVQKGIVSAEDAEHMNDREAIRFIFHPGFSTAAQVTDVSGRGVGMDVVRTNIEKLGGTVDVESVVGAGSTIHIVLPLTLAIIPSLIVVCCQRRFAVPQVNILELVRIAARDRADRIGKVNRAEVLRLRGELLPLIRLQDVLNLPTPETPEASDVRLSPTNIVIVETGESRYGLVVDELRDSEEIVVKPLGKHVKECRALDAATILGDGHIAWILNISGIAAMSNLSQTQDLSVAMRDKDNERRLDRDRQHLLLFTNDASEWFSVPMDVIQRIDRVRYTDIQRIGRQDTVQQRGKSLPVLRLENSISAQSGEPRDRVSLIVYEMQGREIGLVAHRIHDIRTISSSVDVVTCSESGVIGSFVLEDRTVRLVDVYQLTRDQRPDWIQPEVIATPTPARILMAEDSTFFRHQIGRSLVENGFEVVEAADGKEAWETLKRLHFEQNHPVQLVVTDIEMPHMDGLELCQRIKSHPDLRELPVIVVSSLGTDKDVRRGINAGVDEYHVKFNQDMLLSGVRRLIEKQMGLASGQNAFAGCKG